MPPPLLATSGTWRRHHTYRRRLPLWAYDRSVAPADGRPGAVQRMLRERIPGRQLLVDVDAQAGPVIGPVVAVADLGTAGEDLPRALAEDVLLLDAEVVAGQVQVEIGRVSDR